MTDAKAARHPIHPADSLARDPGPSGTLTFVIHPQFGNFILLGTVLMEARLEKEDAPIDYNPCLECKLCVAACPVGAISPAGEFNFSSCYTHNYREFMSGFSDWVEPVADSKDAMDYRKKATLAETVSLWQSLSFGANYKAAYCMAVCPAGEDVVEMFRNDRKGFVKGIVRPLQEKVETVYVSPGSDAEAHVTKRFPHKRVKRVSHGIRFASIRRFVSGMPRAFQPKRAGALEAAYHFDFTGADPMQVTVRIGGGRLQIESGLAGRPDIRITADGGAWIAFLAKERSALGLLLRRKLKIKGAPKLLLAFGRCFAA
jgi:ferredoxin